MRRVECLNGGQAWYHFALVHRHGHGTRVEQSPGSSCSRRCCSDSSNNKNSSSSSTRRKADGDTIIRALATAAGTQCRSMSWPNCVKRPMYIILSIMRMDCNVPVPVNSLIARVLSDVLMRLSVRRIKTFSFPLVRTVASYRVNVCVAVFLEYVYRCTRFSSDLLSFIIMLGYYYVSISRILGFVLFFFVFECGIYKGGSIVTSPRNEIIAAVGSVYAGRANSTPVMDLLITLLSMGLSGYQQLLADRVAALQTFPQRLAPVAEQHGERLLHCPENTISFGITLDGLVRPRRGQRVRAPNQQPEGKVPRKVKNYSTKTTTKQKKTKRCI